MISTHRLILTSGLATLLAACGGGSETTATATDAAAHASAQAIPAPVAAASGEIQVAPPVGSVPTFEDRGETVSESSVEDIPPEVETTSRRKALAVTVSTTGETVVTQDFEANFSSLPPGWWINWWGTSKPTYDFGRESRAGYTHAGVGALRYKVSTLPVNAGANLVYSYAFVKGAEYRASMYLRSDLNDGTKVEVQMRRNAAPYDVIARQQFTLSTGWTQVNLAGIYPFADAGSVRIIPLTIGRNIYVDDMSITKQVPAPAEADAPLLPGGITLPASGGTAIDLIPLKVSTMDESFDRFAPGWTFNSFNGTQQASFVASRETRTGYMYSGAASQKFQVINKYGGDVHLIHKYPFAKDKVYRATLYLRSDTSTPVVVAMRRDAHPWDNFASRAVTLGTSWQKVELEGTYLGSVDGSLRVQLKNATGTVWVDQMTLTEVKRNELAPVGTAPVPDTLFGMHVNRLGVHYNWPGMGTHIIRLWNTGTTWRDLEPANNSWNTAQGVGLSRLDMYVDYALKQSGAQILYTLGQTPQWASTTPDVVGLYGAGASGAPKDMADWRDYVRTLARRYVGKIRYWELWNEPDYAPHWNGGTTKLVEMARIAREELLAADPQNKLVSPGVTSGTGMSALNLYMTAGMGQYIDIVGYHYYYWKDPEILGSVISNIRNLMSTYGISAKPLWMTEGGFHCNAAVVNCSANLPTRAENRSVNARATLMMAIKGVANFNFHYWESTDPFRLLVETDYTTPTEGGRAYGEVRNWLRGAQVVDAFRAGDSVYVARLRRDGSDSFAIWSTTAGVLANVPAEWTATKVRTVDGTETSLPLHRQITVGLEPLLLKP